MMERKWLLLAVGLLVCFIMWDAVMSGCVITSGTHFCHVSWLTAVCCTSDITSDINGVYAPQTRGGGYLKSPEKVVSTLSTLPTAFDLRTQPTGPPRFIESKPPLHCSFSIPQVPSRPSDEQ